VVYRRLIEAENEDICIPSLFLKRGNKNYSKVGLEDFHVNILTSQVPMSIHS
jgi:hypothetical protein